MSPTAGSPDHPPAADGVASGSPAGDRVRALVCAALALPVVALSAVPALQPRHGQWLAFALAGPVVLWGGLPMHRRAVAQLRRGAPAADVLLSLGTLAAFAWSVWALLAGGAGEPDARSSAFPFRAAATSADLHLDAAAGTVAAVLLGREVGSWARRQSARGAPPATGPPSTAGGQPSPPDPAPAARERGLRAAARWAVSAVVLAAAGPAADPVGAGARPAGGPGADADEDVAAGERGSGAGRGRPHRSPGGAPVPGWAGHARALAVPAAVVLAVATAGGWLGAGASVGQAVAVATAVMLAGSPVGLHAAGPAALAVGWRRGRQVGVLVRRPAALAAAPRADTVVVDGPGTLTAGAPSVRSVVTLSDDASGAGLAEREEEVLRLAGAAGAVVVDRAGAEPRSPVPPARPSRDTAPGRTSGPGTGGEADLQGRTVLAGPPRSLDRRGIAVPVSLRAAVERIERRGLDAVVVAVDGEAVGALAVGDPVRRASRPGVAELRRLGLEPVLVTGGDRARALALGRSLGIDAITAEVPADGAAAEVWRLQSQGRVVAVIGGREDHVAAMQAADLALAPASGADGAVDASDVTLARPDLLAVADAVRFARRLHRTIVVNVRLAAVQHAIVLALAVGGRLDPLAAAAAAGLAGLPVAANSLRLRRFR